MIAKRSDTALTVRLPEGLLQRVREEAAKNGRSGNSEIVIRLKESLESDKRSRRKAA